MNINIYKKFDFINERAGVMIFTPIIKTDVMIIVRTELRVKQEFIKSVAFSLNSDINLIRLILNPKLENSEIKPVIEITNEASPTSLVVYILAAINQNIKPEALLITELATRYAALVKSESSK